MSINNESINNKLISKYEYKKQHIFIGGGIATGKTTMLNLLNEYMDYYTNTLLIKEYIDYDKEGVIKLKQLFNGLITDYEFQTYVLNCYEKHLNSPIYENADFILWDRHPSEALEIFCKDENSLSKEERNKLKQRLEQIYRRYEIPLLTNNDVSIINIDTSRISVEIAQEALINIFIHSAMLGITDGSIFVLLYCGDLEAQFKRVVKRGRQVELETYKKKEDLSKINQCYINFYVKLITEKTSSKK
ncbi:hypothetical protein EDI_113690 [Entamoeba dispar SAW760]|uniref:Deoxynucleoside kinase domain-containing protein n=1 Tax=Entamoeba dispar (strain ATCC PRA-260 / SAW760) TaxID=370354 RepID=B0ECM4_ENTDS|nr:uncharacterized protein EDI_113690 [Entamoeba dispar SAW760]EDR27730.1 hypothetical protein EDI_113690 [Entamoeba dispar SAW760]|eukprot:EDR27730.1 hypothetical protein EDI_113690 [Entamoeba dispar SAW760]